jgi:hypothetical protein
MRGITMLDHTDLGQRWYIRAEAAAAAGVSVRSQVT